MDDIVAELVRWHEHRSGVRGGDQTELYERVHDRLREIAAAQRVAAAEKRPLFQGELALMGPADGTAVGYLRLRNRESRPAALRLTQASEQTPLTVDHPPTMGAGETVSIRVCVSLVDVVAGTPIDAALDVELDGSFRLRIWIRVEVT